MLLKGFKAVGITIKLMITQPIISLRKERLMEFKRLVINSMGRITVCQLKRHWEIRLGMQRLQEWAD